MAFVGSTNMSPLWGNPSECTPFVSLRTVSLLTELLEWFCLCYEHVAPTGLQSSRISAWICHRGFVRGEC